MKVHLNVSICSPSLLINPRRKNHSRMFVVHVVYLHPVGFSHHTTSSVGIFGILKLVTNGHFTDHAIRNIVDEILKWYIEVILSIDFFSRIIGIFLDPVACFDYFVKIASVLENMGHSSPSSYAMLNQKIQ